MQGGCCFALVLSTVVGACKIDEDDTPVPVPLGDAAADVQATRSVRRDGLGAPCDETTGCECIIYAEVDPELTVPRCVQSGESCKLVTCLPGEVCEVELSLPGRARCSRRR